MRENYTLIRLYIDTALKLGGEIILDKPHIHYLLTVLRKSQGDRIRVFNGKDGEWAADITRLSRKAGALKITKSLRAAQICPDIWLCFAPVKKHRNAFIVEKATELGVRHLQPVVTQRTQFPKINLERLNAQMIEASEQTERLDIPSLGPINTLNDMLDQWDMGRTLIFADEASSDINAETQTTKPALNALKTIQETDGPCALLIGPEGGFTPSEREHILAHTFVKAVTLGPRILRADTAALALLTLWQSAQGDWG